MVNKKSSRKKKSGKEIVLEKTQVPFIKKVILENFLSFEKDEVEFGDSKFTIIIGPNWSGKTSVFQAIKFCLGSNERDERYHKWSDFIRHGQNHALVELHIQDGKREIYIRRIVIRGQSPYYQLMEPPDTRFKKVPAKKIQELIRTLQYDPDNEFALVSQGKIDAIKNLKPSTLCEFLEKGIGLNDLREEIIHQKDSIMHLNKELESLSTRKNTLNINLELLKPKLERLKIKKELLKKRKKHEDELLWANRQVLLGEIVLLGEKIKKLEKKIQASKNKKKDIEEKIEFLQNQILELSDSLTFLSEKAGACNNELEHLKNEINSFHSEKVEQKKELEQLSDEIEEKEIALANLKENERQIEKEIKIIKKEKKKIKDTIGRLIKEQNEITRKIEQNKKILELHDDLSSKKAQLIKKYHENETLIQDKNNEINQIFQSLKDIEHKFQKNKWFLEDPSKNLFKELDQELRNTQFQLYDIENKIHELEIKKGKALKNLKLYEESLRKRQILLPTPITILKEEIQERELEVKGPIIEFLKFDDKLSYAIESILGERVLFGFIAKDWDTLELLKRLKNKYNAYCNLYLPKNLNLNPFPRISTPGILGYLAELIHCEDIDVKKVIYSIAKNCLVVDNYRSGRKLYQTIGFNGKCVTLKGEQISSLKYVYETPFTKKLKGMLSTGSQKEQIKVTEAEINSINDELMKLKTRAKQRDQQQRELHNKIHSFDDLLYNFNQRTRLTNKKNKLYDERKNLEAQNANHELEIKKLENKIKELEENQDPEIWRWNKRIKEIPVEMNELNEEEKKWEKKLKTNISISEKLKEEINESSSTLQVLKNTLAIKKEEFQKADKQIIETFKKYDEVEEDLKKLKKLMEEKKELKNELEEKKSNIEKMKFERELELKRKVIKLNTLKKEFSEKNEDLDRINSEIGPLVSVEKFELRPIEEIKNDIYQLNKELLNYLDVDDSLLIEKEQIVESLKKITQNQYNLEKDIKEAKNTENELEKAYNTKFKAILKKIESKINTKFKNAKINVLCSLKLRGDFESLEVEIKAGTSKEQLISCSALSGGQISIISICLILSLQEIRPSPLCMLDEAGMFLDERNSEAVFHLIHSTLEQNPIQMILFLPKSSKTLFSLADKLIGIARTGKNQASTVLIPKFVLNK
ncbi:MAG: AAA family ATPase [Promethearchaeota archaeon]